MNKLIGILALLLAFSSTAFALDAEDVFIPEKINVFGAEKTVNIVVDNHYLQDKDLSVEFFGPRALSYSLEDIPSTIEKQERVVGKLKLTPSDSLQNTSYSGTLLVRLDDEAIVKRTTINFYPALGNTEQTDTGTTGFFVLGFLTDSSFLVNIVLGLIVLALLIVLILKVRERAEEIKKTERWVLTRQKKLQTEGVEWK